VVHGAKAAAAEAAEELQLVFVELGLHVLDGGGDLASDGARAAIAVDGRSSPAVAAAA
jgi:hypothetical protein